MRLTVHEVRQLQNLIQKLKSHDYSAIDLTGLEVALI